MKKLMAVIGTALAAVLLAFGLFGCTTTKALKLVNFALTDEDYAFAVQKGNADLMAQANELIAELKASGEFERLVNKYMGDDETDFIKYENPTKNPDLNAQLVVATNAAFAPFEFMAGNYFTGVDIEVAKMLADKIGKPLYIADMAFEAVILSVSGATSDPENPDIKIPTTAQIGMAGLTINEDRKKVVDFTTDYFHSSQYVIVQEDDTTFDGCETAEEVMTILNGFEKSVKIGYQNSTTGEFFTTDLNVDGKGYANGVQAAQELQTGRLKCVIIDEKPAKSIIAKLNALLEK